MIFCLMQMNYNLESKIQIYDKINDDWIHDAIKSGLFLISYKDLPKKLFIKMERLMYEVKKLYLNNTPLEI